MENIMSKEKIDTCEHTLELCPENYPYNPEFYICTKCDATFINSEFDVISDNENYFHKIIGRLEYKIEDLSFKTSMLEREVSKHTKHIEFFLQERKNLMKDFY